MDLRSLIREGLALNETPHKEAIAQLKISKEHFSRFLAGAEGMSYDRLMQLMAISGVVCTVERKED